MRSPGLGDNSSKKQTKNFKEIQTNRKKAEKKRINEYNRWDITIEFAKQKWEK